MPASRTAVNVWIAVAAAALVSLPVALACSSGASDGPATGGPGGGSSNTGGVGTGGANATGGAATQGGSVATGGATSGGATSGGAATGGNAGVLGMGGSVGGTAGSTTGGTSPGGTGGAVDCGTPPWRKLNVTAAVGEHVHGNAGLDTRAKTMLGKLVVDYGVSGGNYQSFLGKRGYHSIGAPSFTECAAPDLADGNRDRVGTCRLGEFTTTEAKLKAQLTMLQATYPEEDWGYFLTQDGNSIRWSDVATTGLSHGATTAALAGRIGACVWRVVSRSGPRDNTCGLGDGKCTAPLSTPSYDPNCADTNVASWLDQPSKTPMDRFYGIVGMNDGQCGDIMFDMHRTKYPGVPTIYDIAGAVLTGTNQFFASTRGHDDYLAAPTIAPNNTAVLDIAFAIPPENQNPKF